jgi:hypothetical protein
MNFNEWEAETAKKAALDVKNGKWSPETAQSLRDLATKLAQQPDATPESIIQGFRDFKAQINAEAQKDGSKNKVDLEPAIYGAKGKVGFYYVINGPGIDPEGALDAMRHDVDGPTAVMAGSFRTVKFTSPGQKI